MFHDMHWRRDDFDFPTHLRAHGMQRALTGVADLLGFGQPIFNPFHGKVCEGNLSLPGGLFSADT